MTIVVLDGHTLNPGDLSWDRLEDFGTLTVHDRTPAELILERSEGAEILLTNKTPLSVESLAQLPALSYIGVLATGYNVVDVAAAAERGIVVTNIPAYSTASVAQMVFALLLALCNHVQAHTEAVRDGQWSSCPDFCFWNYPVVELYGKTIGIVGFGRIGRQVARVASAIGMEIIATDTVRTEDTNLPGFRWVELAELLREADVVSLHCPLFPDNIGMMNRDTIALMKRSAFLINTARGGLVVDADLAEALNSGGIGGAGLDTLSTEPPATESPLLTARNCLITPHIAWASWEARGRLLETAVNNVVAFLAGRPVNTVGA